MSRTRWASLEEAVRTIDDGSSLAIGGFMLGSAPMALIFELVRQDRRDLHVLSLPNPLPAEILVAAAAVRKVEFLFTAINVGGRVWPMPCLKRAIEDGSIEWAEHDGYRLVQRLRAAALGLPFLPVPDFGGTDLARRDPMPEVEDPFTGQRVAVEQAFYPDVALIHAQAADPEGNLWIDDPATERLVASAARRVVATVERRVERLPGVATVPAMMVDQVIEEPHGAFPTGCLGCYPADDRHLLRYLEMAKAGDQQRYIDTVIRASNHQLELAGEAA
nr:3-oxoadipate CoA-transferase subunit A-like [Nerophis lumbriciformis]